MFYFPSESELEYHGIYSGSGCITVDGPLFEHQGLNTIGKPETNAYDFAFTPIDIPDAISKIHDKMQESIVDYQGFLEDTRTLPSDIWLVKEANRYLESVPGQDKYTKRAPSKEAGLRAYGIKIFFGAAIAYKKFKVEALKSKGYDPSIAEHQQFVTLEDWKPKWYKFKQRAQKKLLEKSGGGRSKEAMELYWKQKN